MPTYVYKFVESGETIEVQQAFTDDTLTEYTHPESGDVLAVKKVFQPVGVTFKGSGFFKTDNRGSSSTTPSGSSSESSGGSDSAPKSDSSSSESSSSASSTSPAAKDSGSKPASKPGTTSAPSS